ncbi:degenerin-like protein unc-105 [Tachypleus tridentatus]|uniref:degenerin-like protein unc-105 n=1 Tax=Tachypleus tridentatus TaxID=6853 RepID=UPI003FD2A4E0
MSQISNLPATLSTRLLEDVAKLDLTGNILQINDILDKLQDILENTVLSKVLDLTGLDLKNLVSSVLNLVPNLLDTLLNKRLSRNDFKKYGIRAKDFIRGCLIDQKVCSYRNFTAWQNEHYGNCFTFNDYNNKNENFIKINTNKFGSVYGLRLLLKISNRQENVPFYSPQSGVRVVVHSPSEIAFPEDSGVDIPPRMTGTVSVEKKEIHRLERPHGVCSYESDVDGWRLVASQFNYSKSACLKACRTKQVLTNCNCALSMRLAEFMDKDAEMCPIGEVDKCVNNQLVSENCTCDPGCQEHQYKTTAAYSLMNEDHLCVGDLMGILGTDSEGGLCGENTETLVGVHVYLKSLTVEVIVETPTYTVTSLLSNIGGTLGLFMGLSVITVVEIIELFLSLFVCWCTFSRKNKNSVSATLISPVGQTKEKSSSIKVPIQK